MTTGGRVQKLAVVATATPTGGEEKGTNTRFPVGTESVKLVLFAVGSSRHTVREALGTTSGKNRW